MSAFREVFEPLRQGRLPVELRVVVRTVRLRTVLPMLAFLGLEEVWVVLLFFPAVGKLALVLIRTAF